MKKNTSNNKKKNGKARLVRPGVYLASMVIVAVLFILFPPVGDSPSMKVVIDKDGIEGRYVGETSSEYSVGAQDVYTVPKEEAKVKTYYAAKGQGVVYMIDYGTLDVKKRPSADAKTVSRIKYEEGFVPDTYRCLGYTKKGWFKISTPEGDGYVFKDAVLWDAIDSF